MKQINWEQRFTQDYKLTREDLIDVLSSKDLLLGLFRAAKEVKLKYVSDQVYLRGLIEFSNVCEKDCYYCGIRKSNLHVNRYFLSDDQILQAARFAFHQNFGSIVLQSGEITSQVFINRIDELIKKIVKTVGPNFGITLSCGEQEKSTYKKWFDSGANRS